MARVSIEDCLEFIENRFALVAIASHRTRQLMEGKTPLVRTKNKEAVTALREIADGLISGYQGDEKVRNRAAAEAAAAQLAPATQTAPAAE